MQAFNFNTQPQVIGMPKDVIEGSSKSSFDIAGKAMRQLDDAIENRAFEKSIGNAQGLKDLTGLNPTTKEQQTMLANKMGVFNALETQKQRDIANTLARDAFGLQQEEALRNQNLFQQQQDALSAIQTDEKNILAKDAFAENIKGLPSLQAENKDIATGGFTELNPTMSIADRIGKEYQAYGGKAPTLELLKEQNDLQSALAKATNSTAKRDSLKQMEDAFYQSNPNPTPEQVNAFYSQALVKMTEGNLGVREDRDIKELDDIYKQASGYMKTYSSNPNNADNIVLGDMQRIENQSYQKLDEKQKKPLEKNSSQLESNQIFISGATKVLNEWNTGKIPEVNRGMFDGVANKLRNMTAEGLSDEQVKTMMSNVDFNSRTGRLLGAYMKATSGLAVSEGERKFLTDIFTGGFTDDEKKVEQSIRSFITSMKDESDIIAGQIYTKAPYSATKYRQYDKLVDSARLPTVSKDKKNNRAGMPVRTIGSETRYWDGKQWVK